VNFDFTDDQQAIKSTAHDFLASRYKLETVRRLAEAGEYDAGLWQEISELGWPGIFIAEQHGGQELGVLELTILAEEIGYVAAPSPFLSNAAAGLAIQFAGSDEQQARLLPGVASGESRGTVGVVSDGSAPLVPDAELSDFIVLFDDGSASASTRSTTRGRTRASRRAGARRSRATLRVRSTGSR
jgi:alkylation response protein AidB-like acyl-CoA dehydrogenase